MSKRGDNIHKRKDGRWEGRYKKGRKANGGIVYGSVYGKTYREVKIKLAERQVESIPTEILPKRDITFAEVLFLCMENNKIRLKGGTIHKYQNVIDTHILPQIGNIKVSEITTTMINNFLAEKLESGCKQKQGGLSASYVRSITIVINAAMKFAAEEQLCMPLKTPIYKPSIMPKDITILSYNEQKQLENYLLSELNPTKAGILLSLHTGLRIGEICALAWDDIDFKNLVIHVRHTVARVPSKDAMHSKTTNLVIDTPKTKASMRDIPISTTLLPILLAVRNVSQFEYVISTANGFVNPRTFEYRFHRLLEESGVTSVNYHALRHTFATRCIEAGVDVKSLSEMLGHANVGITLNTYVHSSMDMKRNQLEKLNIISA